MNRINTACKNKSISMKIISIVFSVAACVVANPVAYGVRLTVDTVWNPQNIVPWSELKITAGHFDGAPNPGDIFYGQFVIDDSILITDGDKDGGLYSMSFDVQGLHWGYDSQNGFSGVQVGFRTTHSFSPFSPTFEVQDHHVTGLLGDVYGQGDVPFIDFFTNRFDAKDYSFSANVWGRMEIQEGLFPGMVPEANSFVLILIGFPIILLLAFFRKRSEIR